MDRYQSSFISFAETLNCANSGSSHHVQAGVARWQERSKGKRHSWKSKHWSLSRYLKKICWIRCKSLNMNGWKIYKKLLLIMSWGNTDNRYILNRDINFNDSHQSMFLIQIAAVRNARVMLPACLILSQGQVGSQRARPASPPFTVQAEEPVYVPLCRQRHRVCAVTPALQVVLWFAHLCLTSGTLKDARWWL